MGTTDLGKELKESNLGFCDTQVGMCNGQMSAQVWRDIWEKGKHVVPRDQRKMEMKASCFQTIRDSKLVPTEH